MCFGRRAPTRVPRAWRGAPAPHGRAWPVRLPPGPAGPARRPLPLDPGTMPCPGLEGDNLSRGVADPPPDVSVVAHRTDTSRRESVASHHRFFHNGRPFLLPPPGPTRRLFFSHCGYDARVWPQRPAVRRVLPTPIRRSSPPRSHSAKQPTRPRESARARCESRTVALPRTLPRTPRETISCARPVYANRTGR